MDWQNDWRKRPYLPLLLIMLLAFGLRTAGLDNQSLWWDELKTWERTTIPLTEMIAGLLNIRDQVPFYFMLMRFWAKLGSDAFALRLFSVFWGTVSIPLMYQIGRKLKNEPTGLLAAFLLAISPFHIWYSQEARMYTLLPALLLTTHLFLITALKEQKHIRWWFLYGLMMTAAIYTHYFSFLVVLAHYIFFVLHMRQIKTQTIRWFATMIGVGISFSPWVWFIFTRTDGYGTAVPTWITPINWWEPLLTLQLFSTGFGLSQHWASALGLILFIIGLGASIQLLRKEDTKGEKRPLRLRSVGQQGSQTAQALFTQTLHTRLLLLWLCFPILIILLVSIDYSFLDKGGLSIYHDRYLIVTLPPLLLLVAQGWQTIRHRFAIKGIAFLLITLLSGIALVEQAQNPAFARNDWRTAVAHINSTTAANHVLIGHRDLLLPITYYGNEQINFVQIPPPESDKITSAFNNAMTQQLNAATANNATIWHAEPFYIFDPHGSPAERNALVTSKAETITQSWLNERFLSLETIYFPGLRLTRYDTLGQTP